MVPAQKQGLAMAIRTLWWSSDEVAEELAVGTRLYNPKDAVI